jgi:hypothetical protein
MIRNDDHLQAIGKGEMGDVGSGDRKVATRKGGEKGRCDSEYCVQDQFALVEFAPHGTD